MIERAARAAILALLGRIGTGRLTLVDGSHRRVFGSGSPRATAIVRSPRLWPALLRGGTGMAEAYVDGLWDSPDLAAVIELGARNQGGLDAVRRRVAPVRTPFQRARGALERNTPERSRRDIASHYDLGNDFFALMLDRRMVYSNAIFAGPRTTLEDAQLAKLEHVCARLDLGPRDHVLEIGSGWGAFAVHAAATRGCRVTTTTLSREQREWTLEQVRAAGVSGLVTVLLKDYRELTGTYDKLVSIEMIEAVGWKDLGTFFARCSDLLTPAGAMLLQAITIDDRLYEAEKTSRTFIRTQVFPNGCLPSLEAIARSVARRTDMRTVGLEDITPHYVETLRRWRANFEEGVPRLAAMGYDERFQRLWRLYLCWCEAGFATRRIGDVQIVLAKPGWRGEVAAQAAAPSATSAAGGAWPS